MAAKGDTEIKMKFETAGAAQVKAETTGVYKAQEQGINRLSRVQSEAQRRDLAAKSLARQRGRAEYAQWLVDEKAKQNALIKTAKIEQAQRANMIGMGRAGLIGMAGAAGIGSVAAIISQMARGMREITDMRADLEKTITPLASLGDNVNNLADLRKEVVGLSAYLGRDKGEVAGFLNDLQSSTGNLDPERVKELKKEIVELAQVKGGDIGALSNLMVSSWQIFGDQLDSVNELQNKIAFTEDLGKANIAELAQRLPEVLQSGRMTGLSLDEILATVSGGMLKTGSIEKTMTGMRNFFLIVKTAQEQGIELTGTYMDKLGQLHTMFEADPMKAFKLFGREVVGPANDVTGAIDEITMSLEKLKGMDSGMDKVGQTLAARMMDGASLGARIADLNRSLQENAPALADDTSYTRGLAAAFRNWQIGALAGKTQNPGVPAAGFFGGLRGMFGSDAVLSAGRQIEIENADGPLRDKLLRQNFDAEQRERIQAVTFRGAPGHFAGAGATPEMLRAPAFDLEAERARFPSLTTADVAAAMSETNNLLRKQNDLMERGNTTKPKPGGGALNYAEGTR